MKKMKQFISNKVLNLMNKKIIVLFILLDAFIIQLSWFCALYIRYDFRVVSIPDAYISNIYNYSLVNIAVTVLIFALMQFYNIIWKFASVVELFKIIIACVISSVIQFLFMSFMDATVPRSFQVLYTLVLIIAMFCIRFCYRAMYSLKYIKMKNNSTKSLGKTMIIGAGRGATILINELHSTKYLNTKICCIIDDDKSKHGKYIRGIKIEGGRHDIISLSQKYEVDEIIFAIPSIDKEDKKEILNICKETHCELRIVPGLYQLINGEVSISKLRNVAIEDLLGREPNTTLTQDELNYITGKVVLVTGGGGSIGSELCRQIAMHNPKQLIIIDVYENTTYEIQLELRKKYPELYLKVYITTVCNKDRLFKIFSMYNPDIVFHAAAHKHVPLMEKCPGEAIENNVFGTYNTAKAAIAFGAEKFILISTDKAVNPTSIMGASKRICEMIIQMMTHQSKTEFAAVRFGNVLGSNGSVIPLFERQIREGGPVTVTHPDIVRYFMTINEAVSLVLKAGEFAAGGEIFVLDMGEPVKIVDLATNMIRLSGYKLEEEIKIIFTGLRPGEKLYEEMLMNEEGLRQTENTLIHIARPIEFDEIEFKAKLELLRSLSNKNSPELKDYVMRIVPNYTMCKTVENPAS